MHHGGNNHVVHPGAFLRAFKSGLTVATLKKTKTAGEFVLNCKRSCQPARSV
jgi:hypothetical protein